MNREEALLEAIRTVAPEKEREILNRAEHLQPQVAAIRKPRMNAYGIWADLKFDLTPEELAEERREMWKNFPREFPEGD